jgi:DNA mismatch endonuclease (patch repair protein)
MPRDPAITSKIMAAIKARDTQPEMLLRRELHRRGLRYRLHAKLPGKPDIVFPRAKVVVMVDGDMWHGHGWAERGFASWQAQFAKHADPTRWIAKIGRNIERDIEVNDQLVTLGWHVHRVLESVIRRDVEAAAEEVERVVRGGHGGGQSSTR